ncbi:hypothetical protein V8B97DRAFT_1913388 [Scleroderma yunnanense]
MGMHFARLAQSAVPMLRDVDDNAARQHEQTGGMESSTTLSPHIKSENEGGLHIQTDLAALFEYDRCRGPRFKVVHSGTTIHETGHLASLFMMESSLNYAPDAEVQVHWLECPSMSVGLIHGDWDSFSMILLGIIISGISCFIFGSGTFLFVHPEPVPGSPLGDGILRGEEATSRPFSGQSMFVFSLAVSWLYNLWLWSFNREKVQRDILIDLLHKSILEKFILGTRTSMVVFVLLALGLDDPTGIIDDLLPSDTGVRQEWKATIVRYLKEPQPEFDPSWRDLGLSPDEEQTLEILFGDAAKAYNGFQLHRRQVPGIDTTRKY